ncbi:MAG: hypothetical protein AAFY88_00865 [Acidobacteriota bacterium]
MTEQAYATLLQLRLAAARKLGCDVRLLDPETGFLYEIVRGSKRRLLHGGLSPLNDAVAARVASDKHHTGLVLQSAGLRTPETVRCLRPGHFRSSEFNDLLGLEPAFRFAENHPFPLIVKPNRGSRGVDVVVVEDRDALIQAVEQVWRRDYLALVQVPIDGMDVRIDLLDGDFLFGYLRRPLILRGDGESTVRELFAEADSRFAGERFERSLEGDEVWRQHARPLDAVLALDQRLALETPILNLNRLCEGQRLEGLPDRWLEASRKVARLFNLRHIGIDFKIRSAPEPLALDPAEAAVIEVNASPSLAQMSRMGFAEEALAAEVRIVEQMLAALPDEV